MWSDLEKELDLLKEECFSARYLKIRESLQAKKNSGIEERWLQFRELENSFLYMITLIVERQEAEGWWGPSEQFQALITAHAVRLLHSMGMPLSVRWNLAKGEFQQGNLYRATQHLMGAYHAPTPARQGTQTALWGDDIWDDCYILLALLQVSPDFANPEIQKWDPDLKPAFERQYHESLLWLQSQINHEGFDPGVIAKSSWYGPGFYAAAIELFDHPFNQGGSNKTRCIALIDMLARSLPVLLEKLPRGAWDNRFSWHIGQLLVAWKEKRQKYDSLKDLDALMGKLYHELAERQSENGAWDDKGKITEPDEVVYCTVRALAACYALTPDPTDSDPISRAHKYLLAKARKNVDLLLVNVKGSLNAIDSYQKLLGFRFPPVYLNPLVSLATRLHRLGLIHAIEKPERGEVGTLENVRIAARVRLEESGTSALERLGINDRLYRSLAHNPMFLSEFSGEPAKILGELNRFLSSTLTETRSRSARRLITLLWDRGGFLNFIPLIEHLSLLEQDGAFYKYYRDHLNHEVLLFLLGVYIYFNSASLKGRIDDEIARTYELQGIKFDRKYLPDEFLFRWKMIATFHDIGYLFEVETMRDSNGKVVRGKDDLLARSFEVVERFRQRFLVDYLTKYIQAGSLPEKKLKAEEMISTLHIPLYGHPITRAEDLFELHTARTTGPMDTFNLISKFISSRRISPGLVRDYFELCRSTPVLDPGDGSTRREPFLDHGIMSALVLLKAADVQRFVLKQLNDLYFQNELFNYPDISGIFADESARAHLRPEQFYVRFAHVAGAIALHNIYPALYSKDQCHAFDVKHNKDGSGLEKAFHPAPAQIGESYAISMEESPLAYLTSLADALQDWDRHSFRRAAFDEEDDQRDPLSSSEVTIGFGENSRLRVTPLTKAARERYARILRDLNLYLLDCNQYVTIEGNDD